jgi:TatD DNase family protein
MYELTDIGVNLAHDSFDRDRDAVIDRAIRAGVTRMVITGTDVAASEAAANLAATQPGRFWSTAGVHPHNAADLDAVGLAQLAELLQRPEVVAVGEMGLDFFRNFSPPESQINAFRAQLELAASCELPLFLHQRDAHEPFLELITEYRERISAGVAHCFTGDAAQLRAYLALDLYIGITGWICDERRGAHLLEIIGEIPADRLLLETDAPYLLPRNLAEKPKSRRNEPYFLTQVLATVAEATGKTPTEIAQQTTANASRLFGLSDQQ